MLRAFTAFAWVAAIIWLINSWTNHQPYYESLVAFLMGSASLIGSFFSQDPEINTTSTTVTSVSSGVVIGSVHNSEVHIDSAAKHNSHKCPKLIEEMDLLIAPLYAKINRNGEIISFMSTYLISRLYIYPDDETRKELERLETEIKEIMRQYGHLASDQLYSQIHLFLNLEPEYNQDKHNEAYNILIEIKKLVKLRQDKLRRELVGID